MVATLFTAEASSPELAGLLRPERLPNGTEPEERIILCQETEFPNLVLEIALTSGGVNKRELYRRSQVPEVWFWREGGQVLGRFHRGENHRWAERSAAVTKTHAQWNRRGLEQRSRSRNPSAI
jgi:Uma2 family endonuclease